MNTALLHSVSRLAGLIAGFVIVAGHPAEATPVNLLPDRQVKGAFTQIPQVLKVYSRALALYQAGYPEYSVELFRSAFEADTSFLLAKVGEMHSYRALSLEDHAALVRSQLLKQTGGREFLGWVESRQPPRADLPTGEDQPIERPPASADPSEFERAVPYSTELFAQALRHYSQDRDDRLRILRLYNRYHSRQWEHRIVLMQHLLSQLKKDQPDDANWMSTALWRIRQEQYRRGAGYAVTPNPVETDFAPLLTLYPSSLAASAVRYSIALERASEGAHSEAAALLEDVIRAISEAEGIDVTCDLRANVFFFAAREANLSGRGEQAKEYLAQAQEAAEPACQRGNTCLSSTNREIPVIAAMGVNYAFTRCAGGPGWVFDNFTFGLDRAARVFEFGQVWWQSISPDMRSLAEESGERSDPVSASPPIEQIVALIDQRAFDAGRDPQRDAMLNETFLTALLDLLEKEEHQTVAGDRPRSKGAVVDWTRLFFRAPNSLEFLFRQGSGKWSRSELQKLARRLSMECQKRIGTSSISDNLPVTVLLSVQDYRAAIELLDRAIEKSSPQMLCAESRLRGIALRGLFGPEAELQFYSDRIDVLRQMGFHDWNCGADIFGRAARVAREAGSLQVALQFYQAGIRYLDRVAELDEMKFAESRTMLTERKASLMFFLGRLYEELEDKQNAAKTFRQVMQMSAGSNLSLYEPAMNFGGGSLRDNIFKLAAERLRVLE